MTKEENNVAVVIEVDPPNRRAVVNNGTKTALVFVRLWTESEGDPPYYIPVDKVNDFMEALKRLGHKFVFISGGKK